MGIYSYIAMYQVAKVTNIYQMIALHNLVAPKAPPVITSSPVRTDNHNSSKITFKVISHL